MTAAERYSTLPEALRIGIEHVCETRGAEMLLQNAVTPHVVLVTEPTGDYRIHFLPQSVFESKSVYPIEQGLLDYMSTLRKLAKIPLVIAGEGTDIYGLLIVPNKSAGQA